MQNFNANWLNSKFEEVKLQMSSPKEKKRVVALLHQKHGQPMSAIDQQRALWSFAYKYYCSKTSSTSAVNIPLSKGSALVRSEHQNSN